ncbi:hypothetical protein [Azospirillum sp. ST 5-10]|uniref:hypothetical protein n=1 Tax=unclassified Azospirillum TaxID=2630922 RepID=UPI003F4A70C9
MTAMPDADSLRQLQVRLEQMQSRRAGAVPKEVAEFAGRFAAMLEALNGAGTSAAGAGQADGARAGTGHAVGPAVATLIAQGGFDDAAGARTPSAPAAVDGAASAKDALLGGGPVDARWTAMLLADD